MAISNRDRVGKAFEQLAEGLRPFIERRMDRHHPGKERWFEQWIASAPQGVSPDSHLDDPSVQLRVIVDFWPMAFAQELPRAARNVVFSLRQRRNDWAHNKPFQFDDTYRALDEVEQLLVAVDAPQAQVVGEEKDAIMRARYEADAKRATDSTPLATGAVKGLRPWREVVEPHDDVAQGRHALSEFAADLYAVSHGKGPAEYTDAVEFFRRTFITEGLGRLLSDAVQRVAQTGGQPIVDLQTNFGGGKTHSMIALYHLFSGAALADLPDELQEIVRAAGLEALPKVPRAVLVGTALKPGQVERKEDGTEVRTMWGEMAWQLGGRPAYDLIAQSDQSGTSPGAALDDVFAMIANEHDPVVLSESARFNAECSRNRPDEQRAYLLEHITAALPTLKPDALKALSGTVAAMMGQTDDDEA